MLIGLIWVGYSMWDENSRSLLFILNWFFSLPFVINGIVEVNDSDYINRKQKTMWTFGFIVGPLLTGLIYLLAERKRIVSSS
jgi:hypothetical protein